MKNIYIAFFLKILGTSVFFWWLPAFAESPLLPKESFYFRPDIRTVSPAALTNPKVDWVKTKRAHLRFTAMLYMYPKNYVFYYLERDAETAKDTALELLTDQGMRQRIRGLNVTRANMKNPNLWDYLEQEGIHGRDPDKVFLLIDSGMNGQIPDRLRATLPSGFKNPIQGHFFMSANEHYASSRTYLSTIEPNSIQERVERAENIIIKLEHIPHYTYSATTFKINPKTQKWEPVTYPKYNLPTMSQDMHSMGFGGQMLTVEEYPDERGAMRLMQDLKAYLHSSEAQVEFKNHKRIWKALARAYKKAVDTNDSTLIRTAIEKLHKNGTGDAILDQSIAMDFLEIIRLNAPQGEVPDIAKIETTYIRHMKCSHLLRK